MTARAFGRSAEAYRDYEQRQRERNLSSFLRMCQQARANGEDWIAWVDAGCPDVSTPAGARFATHGAPSRARARSDVRP